MDKFGRSYVLEIFIPNTNATTVINQNTGRLITISPPFTIEFDIIRKTLPYANASQIRIYNLAEKTRGLIRHDYLDGSRYQQVKLRAGYGNDLPVIFQGNISQAWSAREGVNFITQIECISGGYALANGEIGRDPLTNTTDQSKGTFPVGTTRTQVIKDLAGTLPRCTLGAVGNFNFGPSATLTRQDSYTGNTFSKLNELTGGACFIDNEKFYALRSDEVVVDAKVPVINSKSGLLDTPVLERSFIHFNMLFEPALSPNQLVVLDSSTFKEINGEHKVVGVKHRGMISEAVCGDLVTTVEFSKYNPFKPVARIG